MLHIVPGTACCCRRLLRVAHEGLLALAVRQTSVSKGTGVGLSFPAPKTLWHHEWCRSWQIT